MKRGLAGILFVIAAAAAVNGAAVQHPPQAGTGGRLEGKVTAVYDGDTVRVSLVTGQARKVRFIGVDTPEMDDERDEVRLMAFMAKRFTFLRLFGREVVLVLDREKEDAYGRLLAYVETGSGEATFNEVLAAEGFAFGYFKFPFDGAMREKIKAAEASARAAGRGLWGRAPFAAIGPGEARRHLGSLAAVTFKCERCVKRGRYRIMSDGVSEFEAVLPASAAASMPGDLDFKGRTIRVRGIIEAYKGRPQIMIGVPSQINVVE